MNPIAKSRRRVALAFALLAVLVGCSGSKDSSPTSSSAVNVVITISGINGNMSFSPANASVMAGQTVSWRNADTATHAIVPDSGGGFTTGTIVGGATSAPILISTSGTFSYHCSIHPSMTGTLAVQ